MQSVEGLHEQAGECLRLADAAQSSEQRMLFIGMAQAWLALAEQKGRLALTPESEARDVPAA
jgi:hypothetical protein